MSKGKAHQRYEFGTKASITTTRDAEVLAQVKRLINRVPKVGIADRGYRGKSKVNDTQIVTPKAARKNTSGEAMALARKRFRRRAGIEPVVT